MGFFSDLKEDLNQAVNELLPGGEKEEELEYEQEEMEMLKELEALEKTLQSVDEVQVGQMTQVVQTAEEEPAASVEATKVFREAEAIREEIEKVPEPEKQPTPERQPEPIVMLEKEPKTEAPVITIAQEPKAEAPVIEIAEETKAAEPMREAVAPVKTAAAVRADYGAVYDKAERERSQNQKTENYGSKPEGVRKVEEYGQTATAKDGAVIDKSWILDLRSMEAMDETAVITAGMRVKGDILSNGHADVFGEVYGNVQVKGKLNVTGKIAGNSKAEEILADAAKINGDVISDGAVRVGVGTVIVGNVEATDAVIAGAVKGTIDVKGPVIIDATAVVLGNVRAKSIQINNGARIEGMCVLCYAEQSAAKFFEEQEQ